MNMRSITSRVFPGVLALALATAAAGCGLQKKMLYYPDHHLPSAAQLAAHHLRFWPEGQQNYRGFAGTAPAVPGKGTIIVFHGNAGTAADRAYYVQALLPLGYRVILAEYPGYGARQGDPAESILVNDAGETLRLARELYAGPIYLLGESLGCGVAAAAAKQAGNAVDGIILITPWDDLLSVAKAKFPWLPVRLFLSDTYDSAANLAAFHRPVAVIAAERDQVIPVAHAEALYRSLTGTKRMWTVEKAGHNDWPLAVDTAWWREITDFVSSRRDRANPYRPGFGTPPAPSCACGLHFAELICCFTVSACPEFLSLHISSV